MSEDKPELTKRERLKQWQKDHDSYGFQKNFHGDEVIVKTDDHGNIVATVKIQTSMNESMVKQVTFSSQSQMERLFPVVMKGLR